MGTGPVGGIEADVEYGRSGTIVLITGGTGAEQRWGAAAQAAGCRIGAVLPFAEAEARLPRQLAMDAIVVDLDQTEEWTGALAAVERAVADRGCGGIVVAPAGLIDGIASTLGVPQLEHLIDPSMADRGVALALAVRSTLPILSDIGKGQATARLQQLSEEVGRIASILAALSEDEATAAAVAGLDCAQGSEGEPIEAGQIRAIIRVRRLRGHFFKDELFADPAWDMLLDLMAARLERQRVAVSSLCIAAAVPPTTALRWIKALCDQGLLVRLADPQDGRRVFIELSDQSAAAMEKYLRAAQRVSALIV
jgi:DNA-binding transcriptional ArsR family regulator